MGRWIDGIAGETEGFLAQEPVRRKEPLHHFVVPLPIFDGEETDQAINTPTIRSAAASADRAVVSMTISAASGAS